MYLSAKKIEIHVFAEKKTVPRLSRATHVEEDRSVREPAYKLLVKTGSQVFQEAIIELLR